MTHRRSAAGTALADPLTIAPGADAVTVRPAGPATYQRAAEVLDVRGAVADGPAPAPR